MSFRSLFICLTTTLLFWFTLRALIASYICTSQHVLSQSISASPQTSILDSEVKRGASTQGRWCLQLLPTSPRPYLWYGLHLYSAFIQNALQLASHSHAKPKDTSTCPLRDWLKSCPMFLCLFLCAEHVTFCFCCNRFSVLRLLLLKNKYHHILIIFCNKTSFDFQRSSAVHAGSNYTSWTCVSTRVHVT